MKQNFDDFSVREAKRLAQSDVGRQLAALFQQQQGASGSLQDGDLEQLRQSVSAFLQDPKAQALLQRLKEAQHGRNGR